MTIDEAIEILDAWFSLDTLLPLDKAEEALKLGTEALKQLKYWRKAGVLGLDEPLSGETKEEIKNG